MHIMKTALIINLNTLEVIQNYIYDLKYF